MLGNLTLEVRQWQKITRNPAKRNSHKDDRHSDYVILINMLVMLDIVFAMLIFSNTMPVNSDSHHDNHYDSSNNHQQLSHTNDHLTI